MKNPSETNTQQAKSPNLADTISTAFGVCFRRPLVLLIPILLDIWILWGLPITAQPLIDALHVRAASLETWSGLDETALSAFWDQLGRIDLRHDGIVMQFFASMGSTGSLQPQSPQVWNASSGWMLALVVIGLNVGALLLSTALALPLAERVQGRRGWGWRRFLPTLIRLLGWVLLMATLLAGTIIPLALCGLGLVFYSALATQLLLAMVSMASIIVLIMGSFGFEAIVAGGVGPLTALYQSYNIVRHNLSATAALMLTLWVLRQGGAYLLQPLLTTTAGSVGAIIAYGLLSSALVAARMVFYRDRVGRLKHAMPRVFAIK